MKLIQQNSTRKKAMIKALEKSFGIISEACILAKIDRKTHYNWMKADSEYLDQVQSIENQMIDFAESALLKQIEQGNTACIIFFLKCKGKKRGYIERGEPEEQKPSEGVQIFVKIREQSDFELEQSLKELT
jgi:hypothetical protein